MSCLGGEDCLPLLNISVAKDLAGSPSQRNREFCCRSSVTKHWASHYTKSRLRAWFRPDKDVLCFPEWPQDVTASWGRFVMPDQ